MIRQAKRFYEFDSFRLDMAEGLLLRAGESVPLPPKPLETLVVLVENTGRVLEKDELIQKLWPDSFVEEANVAINISQLRKALGERPEGGQYIETVPRRGRRFVAGVREVLDERPDLIVRGGRKLRVGVTHQA